MHKEFIMFLGLRCEDKAKHTKTGTYEKGSFMRVFAFGVLLVAVACSSSSRFEEAKAGAQARAIENTEMAKTACRERGNEVFEFSDGDWVCGAAAKAEYEREERRWRARCSEQGKQVYRGGINGWFCANPTTDAGQECRASTECESACLLPDERARRGQCAALTTILGCFEMLDDQGEKVVLCVD